MTSSIVKRPAYRYEATALRLSEEIVDISSSVEVLRTCLSDVAPEDEDTRVGAGTSSNQESREGPTSLIIDEHVDF